MLYSTAGLQFNNTETDQKDNMFSFESSEAVES